MKPTIRFSFFTTFIFLLTIVGAGVPNARADFDEEEDYAGDVDFADGGGGFGGGTDVGSGDPGPGSDGSSDVQNAVTQAFENFGNFSDPIVSTAVADTTTLICTSGCDASSVTNGQVGEFQGTMTLTNNGNNFGISGSPDFIIGYPRK